jgi:hypothetical protein
MDEIRKKLLKERKRPEPPVIEVEVGEHRVKMKEVNRADPNYIIEVNEYNQWLQQTAGEELINVMVHYSIVLPKNETAEEEAEFKRIVEDGRFLLNLIDPKSDANLDDKTVYIKHYLFADPDDMQLAQAFITGQSMPTEEAVQEHIDSFPGDIPGEEPIRTPGAPIGI